MDVVADDPRLVETASDLFDTVLALRRERLVAVDLEADSMFHFEEKICLIQISTQKAGYILDPLKIPDMSPMAGVFSDKKIRKIFHGADYDVRSLYRDYGITVNNLFDTELASRFLGNKETGLDAVVQKRFNIFLEKKYQKKDWSQRPLPEEMIRYAANDTRYLIPMYQAQIRELCDLGRLDWVLEECADLSRVRPSQNEDQPLFLKFKGAGRLDPKTLAVLEALLQFRRKIARQKDRPLFKVIGNFALLKIAQEKPGSIKQLSRTGALGTNQMNSYGESIVRIIHEALSLPKSRFPHYPRRVAPRMDPDVSKKIKDLKIWREQKAKSLAIDSGVLISNAVLRAVAESGALNSADLDAVSELKQWQKKELGKEMINLLVKSGKVRGREKN